MELLKRVVKKYVIPHEENRFRPHLLRTGGILFLFAVLAVSLLSGNVYRVALRASNFLASVLPGVLVDLANGDRAEYALGQLRVNPLLEAAARMKAEDMAAKSYFAHQSPDGSAPWDWIARAGYRFVYAGENLAINFDDSSAVNSAWMNSPSHRANILNSNFTEVGIATARGMYEGRETTFVVQMFASPARVAAAPSSPSVDVPAAQPEKVPQVVENPVTESPLTAATLPDQSRELTPIIAPDVLGASGATFIAVKDENAEPADVSGPVSSVAYANTFERYVTSPTKILGALYMILASLIALTFVFVVVIRHERRLKHVFYAAALFFLVIGAYYSYQNYVESRVAVAATSLVASR